jgi:branched-chain amino acid transport system permease protein
VVFFAIQHWFADLGAWYLIGLGATAIGFALLAPRGAWGWIVQRWHVQLFPVGYRLTGPQDEAPRDDAGPR